MNDQSSVKAHVPGLLSRHRRSGRVLVVAGSDSSGGAGIQADIKSITANGAYAATAITAVTVQNTLTVTAVEDISASCVAAQMRTVLKDIGADVIKIGMLHNEDIIRAVADEYQAACQYCPNVPILLVDPVMIAKSGDFLLLPQANQVLHEKLLPLADIITPNIPEAEILLKTNINQLADMRRAVLNLSNLYQSAILLKGGHLKGTRIHDVLLWEDKFEAFVSPRIDTKHTHGTGCTLASAIAAGLALGLDLHGAVVEARAYLYQAILNAPRLGGGHGPLGHLGLLKLKHNQGEISQQ